MKKIKMGLIGCGTIGAELARFACREFKNQAQFAYLADHHPEKLQALKRSLSRPVLALAADELIKRSDLVIEAASAEVSGWVAERCLKQGKQALIMSVGGLLTSRHLPELIRRAKGRLWVPSGAVAGIDGVLAAREGKIDRVKLITRKPPRGLDQAPYFKTHPFPTLKGQQQVCVFRGNALQAVRAFPQNINVAAVLSLASAGAEKIEIEIWTSKAYQCNQHEIEVTGDFGRLNTVTRNVPSPTNPKTSWLAVLSAQAALRNIFSGLHLGT